MGDFGGRRGLFPSNYVERIDGDGAAPPEPPAAGGEVCMVPRPFVIVLSSHALCVSSFFFIVGVTNSQSIIRLPSKYVFINGY